jgi:endonuclease/exonuclease/phosphatase family metal-dependent hydrolase
MRLEVLAAWYQDAGKRAIRGRDDERHPALSFGRRERRGERKAGPMRFRVATLNLEQDHKRWEARRPLIAEEIGTLRPDILALNEVSIPLQTARGLRKTAAELTGVDYSLIQQTRVNGLSRVEGEAMLTRFAVIETGNLDYQTRDMVAQVARVVVDGMPLDVYVTHLFMSRGDDSLRLFQVQQLLAWIAARDDVPCIVCGDFNATLEAPSARLMATRFRPTQTSPTAFTPLADRAGTVSHPYWPRMDRCIDYIWESGAIRVVAGGVCFNRPSPDDPSLWPSDHAGVWADLELDGAAAP